MRHRHGPEVLRFDHVTVERDDGGAVLVVLDDVDLELTLGGISVLVGASGSGKSSLLRLCNRLDVPTRGRVLLDGVDLATLDPLALRRRVGMVFQRPTLFAGSVRDNCRVADPEADEQRCVEALERCGLSARYLDKAADDLSGGEAQRACIARTLLTDPDVLLADEVTSALDPENRRLIEALARDLAQDGMAVVWVTHDLAQARHLADRTVVLVEGRVASPDVAAAFLAGGGSDP